MSLKRRWRRLRRRIDKNLPLAAVIGGVLALLALTGSALVARAVFVDRTDNYSAGCIEPEGSLFLRGGGNTQVEGRTRGFNVGLARTDLGRPVPLVVALSDDGLLHDDFDLLTDLPEIGRREGFITVTPERTSVGNDWRLEPGGADDVIVDAIIEDVQERLCVRTDRVYLVGFGTGGAKAMAMACRDPERFAGVGVVGGLVEVRDCDEREPIPLIAIHGADDDVYPYEGGYADELAARLEPIAESDEQRARFDIAASWAEVNECEPEVESIPVSRTASLATWDCPAAAAVQFYTIPRGRHVWPNPEPAPGVEAVAAVRQSRLDAGEIFWEFFQTEWRTR